MGQFDVERRVKIETFKIAALIEHNRGVIIEIAVQLDDVTLIFSQRDQVSRVRYFVIRNTVRIVRRFSQRS